MSAVERALQKLRAAAGGEPGKPARAPIAQVTVDVGTRQPSPDLAGRAPTRTVKFDAEMLRDSWLYSPENQSLADQYRVIKRPLLAKAMAPAGEAPELANLVAVTSALAGEGKTFTSVNLALSIAAEKDWRVLLVDADCKNPQLSRLLGTEQERGLLDVLKEGLHLDDVRMATSIPGLTVVPLGTRDDQAAELFSSARMASICAELARADSHELVIFDTSPLLLTTESSVVAGHCGQVVVVVKAGSTEQQAVLTAVQKIDATKAVGLVLNCAHEHGDTLHYGSYGTYPHVAS